MHRRTLAIASLLVLAAPALAQTPSPAGPPTRIRGTIAAVTGDMMTVTSRDGSTLHVVLGEPLAVASVKPVALSAIKDNDFIGTATRAGADGRMTALEVLVFPEAMRGAGEGFYPWDLEPGSMMTNGTIKGAVTESSGRQLTVAYKDKSNTIYVPPDAPIVTFMPASKADLKPGMRIFAVAPADPSGTLKVSRVTVEKDGVPPPM